MAGQREAAYRYAAHIGPVVALLPRSKAPLTKHAVKDASTDPDVIAGWYGKRPDANVGIACGAPGPAVLDVDDLDAAAGVLADLDATGAACVATPRGRHYYFAGSDNGGFKVPFGEVRGRGQYVAAPPSLHPDGKEYVWMTAEAKRPFPPLPAFLEQERASSYFDPAPAERVPHGGRHNFLFESAKDALLRGIDDRTDLLALVQARFESRCEPLPPPRPDEFTNIVDWAINSDMAADVRRTGPKRGPKRGEAPPIAHDAPRSELFARVHQAMGLPAEIRITEVRRFGPRDDDALHIHLSMGEPVQFEHQGDITTPRTWANTVVFGCNGLAQPPSLKQADLIGVAWALVTLARAVTQTEREAELAELVADLAELAETLRGDLERPAARYELLGALTERPLHEPRDGMMAKQPTLVLDMNTGRRYLRAKELMALARARGFQFRHGAFRGLMGQVGVTWRRFQAPGDAGHREHILYELPSEEL